MKNNEYREAVDLYVRDVLKLDLERFWKAVDIMVFVGFFGHRDVDQAFSEIDWLLTEEQESE